MKLGNRELGSEGSHEILHELINPDNEEFDKDEKIDFIKYIMRDDKNLKKKEMEKE